MMVISIIIIAIIIMIIKIKITQIKMSVQNLPKNAKIATDYFCDKMRKKKGFCADTPIQRIMFV